MLRKLQLSDAIPFADRLDEIACELFLDLQNHTEPSYQLVLEDPEGTPLAFICAVYLSQ